MCRLRRPHKPGQSLGSTTSSWHKDHQHKQIWSSLCRSVRYYFRYIIFFVWSWWSMLSIISYIKRLTRLYRWMAEHFIALRLEDVTIVFWTSCLRVGQHPPFPTLVVSKDGNSKGNDWDRNRLIYQSLEIWKVWGYSEPWGKLTGQSSSCHQSRRSPVSEGFVRWSSILERRPGRSNCHHHHPHKGRSTGFYHLQTVLSEKILISLNCSCSIRRLSYTISYPYNS